MPWSSISNSASVSERSAATVQAGAVITAESGVSGPAAASATRVRMSRSVTIPSPSPRSTTTQVAPASTICWAARCTGISGSQTSAGARISSRTGRPAAGCGSRSWPESRRTLFDSDPTTKRTAAGRSSTGRIACSGIR